MDYKTILQEIKLSLSIEDGLSDNLITSLIKRTESAIKLYISETSIPSELEWIVTEATITRIGLLGSESKESESIEGFNNTYKTDALKEYYKYLDLWCHENKTEGSKSNRVRMF